MIVFTPRQCDVMTCVAHDLTIPQTASQLHLAPRTVKYHLEAAKERAGVRSITALIAQALISGSIVVEPTH